MAHHLWPWARRAVQRQARPQADGERIEPHHARPRRSVTGGKTPLTIAVAKAAEVLGLSQEARDDRRRDGWRGDLRRLSLRARQGAPRRRGAVDRAHHRLSHEGLSWTGENWILDAKCLAEENNGLYLSADNKNDLVAALKRRSTVPCSRSVPLGDWRKKACLLMALSGHLCSSPLGRLITKTDIRPP